MAYTTTSFDTTAALMGNFPTQTVSTTIPPKVIDLTKPQVANQVYLPNPAIDPRISKLWNTASVNVLDPIVADFGPFTDSNTQIITKAQNFIPSLPNAINYSMELGNYSVSSPYISWRSSGNNVSYDSKIIASGGTNLNGQGDLTYIAGNHIFVGNVQVPVADANNEAVNLGQMRDALDMLSAEITGIDRDNEAETLRLTQLIQSLMATMDNTNFSVQREYIPIHSSSSENKYFCVLKYPIQGDPITVMIHLIEEDIEYIGLYNISDNLVEITSPINLNNYNITITYLRKN